MNNLWVADAYLSSIFYISKEEQSWNAKFKISGTDRITGMRNGNLAKASFN